MSFFYYLCSMKKIITIAALACFGLVAAQFKIELKAPDSFTSKQMILYTLNGSKDEMVAQTEKKNGYWKIQFDKPYRGMLRAYFPENSKSINFISDNANVAIDLITEGNAIKEINYIDSANKLMYGLLSNKQKQEKILPALMQIKEFYNDASAFDKALALEITKLKEYSIPSLSQYPFIEYYYSNDKYLSNDSTLNKDDYISFLANSNEMLETSSLLKPILLNFLRIVPREQLTSAVDELLEEVNVESPRGQTILAELLDIFETYGLEAEKEKYFKLASNLKCEINGNLKNSLASIKNTMLGSLFPNYTFTKNVKNTKLKKLSDIKANKKLVVFWASTCPHCMSEIPVILEHYKGLKNKGIEVIAFSLDQEKSNYENTVNALPWINDTELRGWNSTYVETYNVHATPTYFVLDANDKIIDKPNNFKSFLGTIKSK